MEAEAGLFEILRNQLGLIGKNTRTGPDIC